MRDLQCQLIFHPLCNKAPPLFKIPVLLRLQHLLQKKLWYIEDSGLETHWRCMKISENKIFMLLSIRNILILLLKVTMNNFNRSLIHKNNQALSGLIPTLSVVIWTEQWEFQKISMICIFDLILIPTAMVIGSTLRWVWIRSMPI